MVSFCVRLSKPDPWERMGDMSALKGLLDKHIVMSTFIIVLDQCCFLFTSYLQRKHWVGADPFVFVQHKAIQTTFAQLQ